MRYQAPKHVTAIHTGAGSHYIADKNGVINVPADAPSGDHVSLCSAGWTPLEAAKPKAEPSAPKKSAPRKPKAKKPAVKAETSAPGA